MCIICNLVNQIIKLWDDPHNFYWYGFLLSLNATCSVLYQMPLLPVSKYCRVC